MIPPLIVEEALRRNIQWIAITDHNASANIQAVQKAASGSDLIVFPGMELQTREEVHLLCLFDTLEQCTAWQAIVDRTLPDIENRPDYFGEQFIVDETGDFLRREERLLLTSSQLSLEDAVQGVMTLQGLAIPAHIDRQAYGLIAQLGFMPFHLNVPALEISRHISPKRALEKYPQIAGYPLIQGGDAHLLEDLLGPVKFTVNAPTVAEIRLAITGEDQRYFKVCCHPNSE